MEAGKRTLFDIFNGNRILEIPFFQRSYIWGEDQWERLLDDLETITKYGRSHFFGSIILKQKETNSNNPIGDIRTLIDGQQRLTTLNIFFKVLTLKTDQNDKFDRGFKLENNQPALWHNHNDVKSFEKILNLKSLKRLYGDDSIYKAYNYFYDNIDTKKLDRLKILSNITFVGIDLGVEEDEQQIFDTINSLGVRLSTAELLKNYFFDRNDLEKYRTHWEEIFEKDEETKNYWDKTITTGRLRRSFIDLFFYSYLQIKIQEEKLDIKAKDKEEFSKVETLFESYKKLIKNYGVKITPLLDEIKSYATAFKNNFDYDIVEGELDAQFGIERINAIIFGLETTTLIPYVLYVLKNLNDSDEKRRIFEYLESYIMRRMVVHANTKNYNQLFTDRLISNRILNKDELKKYIEKRADKINYMPNDEDLKKGFKEAKLINRQAAGIIYLIESKIRDRGRQATQLLGLKKYSLEHLMPKKWDNNWGGITTSEESEIRNKKLLTLGNLAIIPQSLNKSIRDANWSIKKAGKGSKYGLYYYSAGIETLAPFLELEEWNETKIDKRADWLFEKARSIWEN